MKAPFQQAPDNPFIGSLDDLLAEAMTQQANRNAAKKVATIDSRAEKAARPKLTPGFYDPINWSHSRTISLIHQPTNTLLGNFKEFLYVGSRVLSITDFIPTKLVRVEEPVSTDGLEFVQGDWWLQREAERHADPKSWIESRAAIIGISLPECGLHCDAAEVVVRLEHGWIARVELLAETRFTCAARNHFLTLPAGLDVLEAMSFDSKIALKSEMKIGEEE